MRVCKPRLAMLTVDEQREAVVLLADLISAAAAKRHPVAMGGVLDGVCDSAFGGTTSQEAQPARAGGA